jgi:hypothetical protein
MTTLNELVGIVFNFPAIVASTSLSSQRAVLIHQFADWPGAGQGADGPGDQHGVGHLAADGLAVHGPGGEPAGEGVGRELPRIGEMSVNMKRRWIGTGMNTTSIPDIFARYTQSKYHNFQKWLNTKRGQTVAERRAPTKM